jgi:hypothetical protein
MPCLLSRSGRLQQKTMGARRWCWCTEAARRRRRRRPTSPRSCDVSLRAFSMRYAVFIVSKTANLRPSTQQSRVRSRQHSLQPNPLTSLLPLPFSVIPRLRQSRSPDDLSLAAGPLDDEAGVQGSKGPFAHSGGTSRARRTCGQALRR